MVVLVCVIAGFAVFGAIMAIISVVLGTDFSELLPVYNVTKKKVGPAFWGHYDTGSISDEKETIVLPKITFEETVTAGGRTYSMGKPVKSARK